MKTTNAVINYVNRAVSRKIPEPTSTLEYVELQKEAEKAENEYVRKMQVYSDNLVKEIKEKHPNLADAPMYPRPSSSIHINIGSTNIAKQTVEDTKLRADYISDIVARIVAGISTVKDMDALDIFIANTIERMSK